MHVALVYFVTPVLLDKKNEKSTYSILFAKFENIPPNVTYYKCNGENKNGSSPFFKNFIFS